MSFFKEREQAVLLLRTIAVGVVDRSVAGGLDTLRLWIEDDTPDRAVGVWAPELHAARRTIEQSRR